MPRNSAATSLDEIIRSAVQPVIQRTSGAIAKAVAAMVAEQLDSELQRGVKGGRGRRGYPSIARRRRQAEMTKWVADRRARRVPKFVIKATGLDTKKKIVAKYGENAAFEIGKPLPKTK